jgi:hypothetical protein
MLQGLPLVPTKLVSSKKAFTHENQFNDLLSLLAIFMYIKEIHFRSFSI